VDETPMGVRLDSMTMRDGAQSGRFLTAVDALARKIGPISGRHSFTARCANVFWRAALMRFAQETQGHVYVFSMGAGENSAIIKAAMPGLTVRANLGFITAISGGALPRQPVEPRGAY